MLKTFNILKWHHQWNVAKITVRWHPYISEYYKMLKCIPKTCVTTLPNGIRVATAERSTCHASVGIYYAAGSRYEYCPENGSMNFFQRFVFGSTREKPSHVLSNQMRCTGAIFDCFVEKELAGFTATCLNTEVAAVLELLIDCIYYNGFEETLLDAARVKVYEQMRNTEDDTSALVFEYLHSTAFQGTGLAQPIAGTSSNVPRFSCRSINDYLFRTVTTDRTVVVIVGNVKHDVIAKYVASFMSCFQMPDQCKCSECYRYTGSSMVFRDDRMPKADIAIGFEAPSYCDDDRMVMDIVGEILGGWDRTQPAGTYTASYLARAASIVHLADSFAPFNFTYCDGGLFGVKLIASPLAVDDMIDNVMHMVRRLALINYEGDVQRGKRLYKAKLLKKYTNNKEYAKDAARQLLFLGNVRSIESTLSHIDHIPSTRVTEVCHHYFYDKCPVVAGVGTVEGVPEYIRLRSLTWSVCL